MVGAYKDWRVESKCATLDSDEYDKMFFPEHGRTILKAKKFCSDCPVKAECLEAALLSDNYGVWAGTDATERQAMRKFKHQLKNSTPQIELNIPATSRPRKRKVTKTNFVFS